MQLPSSAVAARNITNKQHTTDTAVCTWHDMAGHWLRMPGSEDSEREAQARRMAAILRWRGLTSPGRGPSAQKFSTGTPPVV
jgi:hypothetical protein